MLTLLRGLFAPSLPQLPPAEDYERRNFYEGDSIVQTVRGMVETDTSGNLGGGVGGVGVELARISLACHAALYRIQLDNEQYTPAAPLTSGWMRICINAPDAAHMLYPIPPVFTTVLPGTITENEMAAQRLAPGERLMAYGASLPANLAIGYSLQFRLWDGPGAS